MMTSIAILISFAFNCFVHGDFQQIASDLQRQKVELQKKTDPLIQQAAELERQSAELKAQQMRLAEQTKEILIKTEAIQSEGKTAVSQKEIDEILIGQIGYCKIKNGKNKNELYIMHDNEGAIRIVFADVNSPSHPVAQIYKKDGLEYYQIEQKDFDPVDVNNKSGPMRALIRLDSNKKVVHAVFKGESIKDKALGFGSSLVPRGVTCLTMEATDSI